MTIKHTMKTIVRKQAPSETQVVFILDNSGSMQTIQKSTINGFNEYIQDLKKNKENNYKFSLTLFNTDLELVHIAKDIKDVEELTVNTYRPNGMTALYDAVCTTVKKVEKKAKENQNTIVVIMTDGEENSSAEFDKRDMSSLIKKLEKTGKWSFVYMGANQDAYQNAQAYGIRMDNAVNLSATPTGMRSAFSNLSTATVMYASTSGGSAVNNSSFFSTDAKNDIENSK